MIHVGDDSIHSVPEAGFFPECCDRRPELRTEQFGVQDAAVEVDARAGGIAAARPFLGMEGGVPEIVVDVVGADAGFGDPRGI